MKITLFTSIALAANTSTVLAKIIPYKLPWWHPEIQHITDNKIPGPSDHPKLDNDQEFQRFIRKYTDESHRFFDSRNGRKGYIERPFRLPGDHPDCDRFFELEDTPYDDFPTAYFDHPDILVAYLNGDGLPKNHPTVSLLLKNVIPEGHPDVDDLFENPRDLPDWHPDLSVLVNQPFESSTPAKFRSGSSLPISVFSGHPDLTTDYDEGESVDDHPSVHFLFEEFLPPSHPDIDDLIHDGYSLPEWHPKISSLIEVRSLETSPASLLSVAVALIIIAVLLLRNVRKVFNWKRTKEIFPDQPAIATKPKGTERSLDCTDATARNCDFGPNLSFNDALVTFSGLELETSFEAECIENVGDLPRLDQRHHIAMEMHRNHRDSNLAPTDERVRASIIAYKEKKNTHLRSCWKGLCSMRIPKSDWSTGEGMICLCYLVINIAALMVSPTYGFDVAFGSLSVGNTLFLVALATRNSIFTWVLGMAFDQMLVYHRFLGRITILTAVIHALFYVKRITDFSDPVILTGVISLGCGLLIAVTSLNCIRRRFFNIFFYSHFAFIGFLVGIFMHAPGAQPFIVLSIVSYIIDKVLQMIWTQLPRKTTKFEKAGDRTAHVQFAKTPLSKLLGRHKVGQYVFVNFPELALNEWHPFSVASAPNDPNFDIYIRALGDHTKKIVDYSERCASENKQAMIRCDGPYGDLSFNYRRYGVLVLAGGGIGITPLLSILKDIYEISEEGPSKKKPKHCIKTVSLVWVMTHSSEASLFLNLLNDFYEGSLVDSELPKLKLSIHITRDNTEIHGHQVKFTRPDFNSIMEQCVDDTDDVTSCLVYGCGPAKMINNLWDASLEKNSKKMRVDFYHESFEF